jgi:PAS domain S-box-containing protein
MHCLKPIRKITDKKKREKVKSMREIMRILILEDNPYDVALMEKEIEMAGIAFNSKMVSSEKTFLDALDEFKPDIILGDFNLPSYDGISALEKVQEKHPNIPFIFVSGTVGDEFAVELMKKGAIDYVIKSNLPKLGPAVKRALQEVRVRKAKKQTEQALKQSGKTYRAIFENTGTATVIIEEDMTLSLVNSQFETLSGYSKEEIENKKKWFEFVDKKDIKRMKKHHRERRKRDREAPARYEFDFIDRIGNTKNILLYISMIPGTKKSVASLLDITRRKELEKKFLHSQKMEAIGKLAGGIAHKFNNLLMAMGGYSELLLNEINKNEPGYENAKKIKEVVSQSSSLTKQLLAFSRKQNLDLKPVNINSIIEDTQNLLKSFIGENIQLNIKLNPDLEKIKADADQLQQVILNLAVNARDAMPNGGIFSIQTKCVELSEEDYNSSHYVKPGKFICVTVSDTGIGIDKKLINKIFEPFFSTKQRGKGTGLGLSTVYGIVKQHNGWINVKSKPAQGTTFELYFPVASQPTSS